jgi:hypothetical protein
MVRRGWKVVISKRASTVTLSLTFFSREALETRPQGSSARGATPRVDRTFNQIPTLELLDRAS